MAQVEILSHSMFIRDENESAIPLLFLHGIPVDHTLWDGVIDALGPNYRVVAPDFLGFGKSDKPLDIEYKLETYTKMIEELTDALHLDSFVIVAMDLGLMAGLNYWVKHPGRVKGLILFEGLLAGLDAALSSQQLINRLAMSLMRKESFARKAFVLEGVKTTVNMIRNGTVSEVPSPEKFVTQFSDPALCEKVLLRGVCAHTISNSTKTGDLADAANRYYAALCSSGTPKTILYANPGAAVSAKFVRLFRAKFKNCKWVSVGKGKHYLPFDQPDVIAREIKRFIQERMSVG